MLTKTKKKKKKKNVLNSKFGGNPFSSFEYVVIQERASKHDLFIKP